MCEHDDLGEFARRGDLSRRQFGAIALGTGLAALLPQLALAAEKTVGTDVMIKTPDGAADAYFVHPASGVHPAVLMWPDIFGLRPAFKGMATRLADEGYSVLVVNPFYRSQKAPTAPEHADFKDPQTRDALMALAHSLTPATAVTDANAFVDFLVGQSSVDAKRKIGTMGYCMSGPIALRTAAAQPDRIGAVATFHGGGLVSGSVATHDPIGRALASAGGCRVISIEYRLAPEYPFPAALEDALAAVTEVAAQAADFGVDVARLGICGDSAGGTIAAATCQSVARIGSPHLALQLLICPILDYSRRSDSRRALAEGYFIDQATLDHDLRHYAPPGVDPADPRISPLRATDLSGLPRTLIHTAEFDPMRDEGHAYYECLKQAHLDVSYTCHPGMIHLFYGLGRVIPYARIAFEMMGRELRSAFA